jgi:ubiquinone/menaquinone biosynthesis C-methylase UbiE
MQSNAASSPFEGAATYYDRYRAPYAPETIEHLVSAFGLDDTARVLDLGCGPGTIAIPISRFVAGVLAVDPDAAMVVEGRRLAQELGRSNIQWRCSRAEDLPPTVGKFRIVTMGQSFHWMERDQVLHRLSEVVEASGGLALVNPGKRRPQESWEDVANKVVAKYLGPPSRHPQMHPETGTRTFPSTISVLLGVHGARVCRGNHPRSRIDPRLLVFELEGSETVVRRPRTLL